MLPARWLPLVTSLLAASPAQAAPDVAGPEARYAIAPEAEVELRGLLRPHAIDDPGGPIARVAIAQATVHVTLRGASPCELTLAHPDAAEPGDRPLPSFTARLTPAGCGGDGAQAVLDALTRNDAGRFPWKSLAPPSIDPRREGERAREEARGDDTRGDDRDDDRDDGPRPAQRYEQIPWHEPAWSERVRRVRALGVLGWMGVLGLIALLTGLVSWLLARRRTRAAEESRPSLSGGARWLLAALALALWCGVAALFNAAVHTLLPAPVVRRGNEPRPPRPPRDGELGVYAYGASTMAGEPYYEHLNIARVVQWCLGGQLKGAPLHVDNLATAGTSFEMVPPIALYDVLARPDEFRPQAILLYLGHNEHWTLGRDVRGGDLVSTASLERERLRVEARYEATLRDLAERARSAGAALIVGLPVGNLDGAPPQRSRHDDATPEARREVCEARVTEAEQLLARGDPAGARAALDEAQAASPGYALTYHLRSRARRALGDEDGAREDAWRAVTQDARRSRAMPSQNAIIRRLCADGLARCVDAEAVLRARFGTIDDQIFVDFHHPRAPATLALGEAFARELAAALELPSPAALDPETPPPELDVAALEFQVQLHTASWYLSYELGYHYDDYAVRDAKRHVRESLAAARALVPDDHEARARLAFVGAVVAALDDDRPTARRLLDEARAAPLTPWVARALEYPRYVELLGDLLDG